MAYAPGVELRVAADDGYWGRRPTLRSITFRFGPDEDASRLLAVRQADAVGLVPYGLLPRVSGRTDRLVASRPGRAAYLLLNVGGVGRWALLKEDAVRRAVALAVDNEVVTEAAWPGHGEPNATLVPPLVLGPAAEGVPSPDHDLAGAQRLLDGAGWLPGPGGLRARDGRPLTLSLLTSHPEEAARAMKVVGEQLARVGVGVEVLDGGPDPRAALARVNEAAFDLFLDIRPQDDANPCALCRFFSIRPGGQLSVAGAVGGGEEADLLFDRAFTAPSLDSARRHAAELMHVVTAERVVAVPLATLRSVWLVSPRLQGFDPSPLPGAQRWDGVSLSV